MADLRSSSDDECVFTGARAGDPSAPVRVTLPSASRGTARSSQGRDDGIADFRLCEEDAQVVFCNEAAVEEPYALHCGSPAAAAKRRALRNQERLRTSHLEARLAQEAHRSAGSSGASAAAKDREKYIPREDEKVLDVRCLSELCGRGRTAQSQPELRDLEDPSIALWGGSVDGSPDWLPLPAVKRSHGVRRALQVQSHDARMAVYGRKDSALKDKLANNQADDIEIPEASLSALGKLHEIKMMLGLDKKMSEDKKLGRATSLAIFISSLKKQVDLICLVEAQISVVTEFKIPVVFARNALDRVVLQEVAVLARQEEDRQGELKSEVCRVDHSEKGDKAVACLGAFDVLPAGTVLGPPYGGALRPAAELAMMQMVHDRLKSLPDPPRQCYAFRIDNLEYIGKWEGLKDKAEGKAS
ncbi:hypothetical protein ACSSS7_003056 [Eimeria intestinalis]